MNWELVIGIALLVITVTIGYLATFKKMKEEVPAARNKKTIPKKEVLTKVGWCVSILTIAGLLVGIFREVVSNNSQRDATQKINELQSDVSYIRQRYDTVSNQLTRLESTLAKNNIKIVSYDSLRLPFMSLSGNTFSNNNVAIQNNLNNQGKIENKQNR